jgi:hypothetical protein
MAGGPSGTAAARPRTGSATLRTWLAASPSANVALAGKTPAHGLCTRSWLHCCASAVAAAPRNASAAHWAAAICCVVTAELPAGDMSTAANAFSSWARRARPLLCAYLESARGARNLMPPMLPIEAAHCLPQR